MKKVALSVLALLAVGSMLGAQTAAVSGSASVKYTYDLDASTQGFSHDTSYAISVPFALGGAKKGAGDVYGDINISGGTIGIKNDNGTAKLTSDGATVAAKIVAGAVSVTIASTPGFDSNYAAFLAPVATDDWKDASVKTNTAQTLGGGLAIGYSLGDMGSVTGKVATSKSVAAVAAGSATYATYIATGTETDATGIFTVAGVAATLPLTAQAVYVKSTAGAAAVTASKGGDFAVGASANLVIVKDLLTLNVNLVDDLSTGGKLGYGAQAIVAVGPAKITAGYDAQDTNSDLGLAVSVAFAPITAGLSAYMNPGSTVTEYAATLAGAAVIEGLNFSAYYKQLDEAAALDADSGKYGYAGASVDYTMGAFKIYGAGDFNLGDSAIKAKAGVTASIIDNASITAEWVAGSIANNTIKSAITNMKSGAVSISVKVGL